VPVVIKRSAAEEIRALVADLDAQDDVRREAAIARLAVSGTRAVDRVVALLGHPSIAPRATVSALRILESIGDTRALPPALALLESPLGEVGAAAVGVLRTFLQTRHGTAVLDRLVACSLDPARPDATRLAALDALVEVGDRVVTPVWERLRDDASVAVRQRATKATGTLDPLAEIEAAATGALPDDPDALTALLGKTGATASLTSLHRLVDLLKAREAKERPGPTRTAWLSARGAVHLALADRQSRVALYDLLETVAGAAGPLPGSFLGALTSLGDAAALEAVAAAYSRSLIAGAPEWRDQLKGAFRAIAGRERVGARHAVMKRIEARWPAAAAELVEKKTRKK
jgi:hypothetical protein